MKTGPRGGQANRAQICISGNISRYFALAVLLPLSAFAAPREPDGRACIECHAHETLTISAAKLQQCQSCHAQKMLRPDILQNAMHDLQKSKHPNGTALRMQNTTASPGRDNSGPDKIEIAQTTTLENKPKTKPGRKPNGKPKELPREEAEGKPGGAPIAVTAGMRYPLYYQGTRLGDTPNKMVLIKAGPFTMGTDERLPDEGPAHKVVLPAYYIDIYEVTNLQYKKFNNETHRRSPRHFRNRTFPEGKADHPVTYVSWDDAQAYCQWAGKRLPTDQEWEKAARGSDARIFPWGGEFDVNKANTPLRWKRIGQFGDTTPVGAFEAGASAAGVYDMSGNVWEWTSSWYQAYPGNTTRSESYGKRYKTLKGGSWFDCSFYNCGISAPVYNRAFFAKRVKNDSFGFRCAKDADGKK